MSELLARLLSAGTDPSLVAEVAREIGRLEGIAEAARAPDRAAENRRAYDRERKRLAKSTGIPPESAESAETPPALDKEIPPGPPKEIKSTPRAGTALARKAAGFGPPEAVELPPWNEFCAQRKKPLTSIAYSRIVETLTEAAQVGWPPGELVARAIASGWETVFIPKDGANGRRPTNGMAGTRQSSGRTGDGFINAIRESRANREAMPWDADDPGRVPRLASLG